MSAKAWREAARKAVPRRVWPAVYADLAAQVAAHVPLVPVPSTKAVQIREPVAIAKAVFVDVWEAAPAPKRP